MIQSHWNDSEAKIYDNDPVGMRVYTSRLIGKDENLVLHGGGNTSVKHTVTNLFGEEEEILYVKGSGWDLATIEKPGFAPVRMDTLLKMAELEKLSDTDMVKWQKAAMINPGAPNPSIEAILHAVIPFKFVDHTHADAVVTVTNTPDSETKIREIYGESVVIIPYVMPGFILARKIYEITKGIDWSKIEGLVLMHHGIFSFSDDAKESYERMIKLVGLAENYIEQNSRAAPASQANVQADPIEIAQIRKTISNIAGKAMVAKYDHTDLAVHYSNQPNVSDFGTRGPLTPDHVIRTKSAPAILGDDFESDLQRFESEYQAYFERNKVGDMVCISPYPCWAVWKGKGAISFSANVKGARIVHDIKDHTMDSIFKAETMGGWVALSESELFEMEYWELEQAKLKKGGKAPELQGKIALITGAASGIGKACVETLNAAGAAVIALDINPEITTCFSKTDILGITCDVTDEQAIQTAVEAGVLAFGGIDIVVSNAGIFPQSMLIDEMDMALWEKNLNINLTSHQLLMKHAIPYLKLGIDPAVIMIASKNVPSPGPGAAAYSVAKAGQNQLGRVAALELAKYGVRVNMLHPHAVFDTGIWTDEVLQKRAEHYGLTIEEYKKNNLLKTEIKSADVAKLTLAMAGSTFAKTTGAQVAIDGGSDRII